MAQKQRIKIFVDLLMLILLLALMAYSLTGDFLHEWLGLASFVLYLLHHILNDTWSRHLTQGRYSPYRIAQTVLVFLVLLCMLGLMISGVMLSRHIFSFLGLRGGMSFARTLHMLTSYWGFLLICLHLGLHWGQFLSFAQKLLGPSSPTRRYLSRLLAAGIAIYGVFAFFKNHMADYLFYRSMFVFFDAAQPPAQFFAEYLAMLSLWVGCGYYGGKLLHRFPIHHNTKKKGPKKI